jgi:tetratricopeptide (TPR) repeat protein
MKSYLHQASLAGGQIFWRSIVWRLIVGCICGFTMSSVPAAWGQSAAAGLYNQGNALYREGDFEAALELYLRAAESSEDARLFYNLGNAAYKTGRLGQAILWYERALRLAPRDADIQANLVYARLAKLDREEPGPNDVLGDFLYGVYLWPALNHLSLLLVVGLAGVFGLGLWRLLRPSWGGWIGGIALAALLSLVAGGWLAARIQNDQRLEAVVLAGATTARSGPEMAKTALFELHEGTKVKVDRQEGDWVLVRLPNGLGGWLPLVDLGVI